MKKKLKNIFIVILIFLVLLISAHIYFTYPSFKIVHNNTCCTTAAVLPNKVVFYNSKLANDIAIGLSKEEYNIVKKDMKELKEKLKDYETTDDKCVDYVLIDSKRYSLKLIEKDERIKYLISEIFYILDCKENESYCDE